MVSLVFTMNDIRSFSTLIGEKVNLFDKNFVIEKSLFSVTHCSKSKLLFLLFNTSSNRDENEGKFFDMISLFDD